MATALVEPSGIIDSHDVASFPFVVHAKFEGECIACIHIRAPHKVQTQSLFAHACAMRLHSTSAFSRKASEVPSAARRYHPTQL